MPKFRKKPVVIDAWLVKDILNLAAGNWRELPPEVAQAYERGELVFATHTIHVTTLEGEHVAGEEDWLIRGVKGEFYGCRSDIFDATYEAV